MRNPMKGKRYVEFRTRLEYGVIGNQYHFIGNQYSDVEEKIDNKKATADAKLWLLLIW